MNRYEQYNFAGSSTDALTYEFISVGPNGHISKLVQFTLTAEKGIYNLAFGNMKEDGSLDDYTTNNNNDRNKILATVAAIVYDFTCRYADCYVFFTGSTKERTRLYRIAISVNYNHLTKSFNIWGLRENKAFEIFCLNQEYHGFLIKRKEIYNFGS